MKYGGDRLELEIKHTPKQICTERKNSSNVFTKDSEEQFTKTGILDIPQIEDKRDGTYSVKFTPHESGTYVISVRIQGQHILVIIVQIRGWLIIYCLTGKALRICKASISLSTYTLRKHL